MWGGKWGVYHTTGCHVTWGGGGGASGQRFTANPILLRKIRFRSSNRILTNPEFLSPSPHFRRYGRPPGTACPRHGLSTIISAGLTCGPRRVIGNTLIKLGTALY